MGYFSNGREGLAYEAAFCDRCVHMHPEHSCPCWDIHMLENYHECNNPDSVLHKMIPQTKDGLGNEQCNFFTEKP